MKELRALIDLDGTISRSRIHLLGDLLRLLGRPHTGAFLHRANESLFHLDDEAITRKLLAGLSSKEKDQIFRNADLETWASRVTICPGVVRAFRLLKKYGFRTYVCTARHEPMRQVTEIWLKKNGLSKYVDGLFLNVSRHQPSHEYKADLSRALVVTHVFEDSWPNMEEILSTIFWIEKAYLINQPWNEKIDLDDPSLYPVNHCQPVRFPSFYHAVLDAVGRKYEPRT